MSNKNQEVNEIVNEVEAQIELLNLESKLTVKNVAEKLNEIIEKINSLKVAPVRNRGPKSTREMTEADARDMMIGEHRELSHNAVAKELGLSYGQVYSARKGFTFKSIYREWEKTEVEA